MEAAKNTQVAHKAPWSNTTVLTMQQRTTVSRQCTQRLTRCQACDVAHATKIRCGDTHTQAVSNTHCSHDAQWQEHTITHLCKLPTAAQHATCNQHTCRRTPPSGGQRPGASGRRRHQKARKISKQQSPCRSTIMETITSYSPRELLSGALVGYNFVRAPVNPHDEPPPRTEPPFPSPAPNQ